MTIGKKQIQLLYGNNTYSDPLHKCIHGMSFFKKPTHSTVSTH